MEKIIYREEIVKVPNSNYDELFEFLDIMEITPIVIEDDNGVWRFRTNAVIRYLLEYHDKGTWKTHGSGRGLNLIIKNCICKDVYTLRDIVELYISMGYSLCGFMEIFENVICKILRIEYDEKGNFIKKLGPTEETISYIDDLYRKIKYNMEEDKKEVFLQSPYELDMCKMFSP